MTTYQCGDKQYTYQEWLQGVNRLSNELFNAIMNSRERLEDCETIARKMQQGEKNQRLSFRPITQIAIVEMRTSPEWKEDEDFLTCWDAMLIDVTSGLLYSHFLNEIREGNRY